ncbi:MAG: hypothetical protein ABSE84_25370 [Isosphaeraceae bacterium]|jgi:hypothetical protein
MTTLAEVKVVTADECGCHFANDYPITHDELLKIESMGPVYAAILIANLISDEDLMNGEDGMFDNDPDDFKRFIAEHNWADPVGMAQLGDSVGYAMNQAWKTPTRAAARKDRHECERAERAGS